MEFVGRGRRIVGEQPLLARSQVCFGPGHAARPGLHRQPAHPHRRPLVIARSGRHELDRVE